MKHSAPIPPSCATLAAQLIVEGCLRMIRGDVSGKAPIEPVVLTEAERKKLGVSASQLTLFYPAGQSGVYFDADVSEFTIWFNGGDCEKATNALHDALMRDFPTAQQLDDVPDKKYPRMRARVYRIELGDNKLAAVETSFARSAKNETKFVARVIAQKRGP